MQPVTNSIAGMTAAIAMIAVFALVWGGFRLLRRRGDTTKGWLMLACAVVILGNVLIWTV